MFGFIKISRKAQIIAVVLILCVPMLWFCFLADYFADHAEFKSLKGRITDKDFDSYIAHRTEFFGSEKAYRKFAAEADVELKEIKGLRNRLDLKGEGQTILYRWVRKAYADAGIIDIPDLILMGGNTKLLDRLENVQNACKIEFRYSGFNPRPMKSANYRYRLGTLSEHALGNAIDIDIESNAILSSNDWAFVEEFTGRKVDRSASRWADDPHGLWKDIKELNDLFVQKLTSECMPNVSTNLNSSSSPQSSPHGPAPVSPKVVLGDHFRTLQRWTNGFFAMDWPLVEQLHKNDFLWGVTFNNPDFQHFELKAQ